MNLKQVLRLPSRHAGSIVVIAIASGLAILSLQWLGYDFSFFTTAYIGDLGDTLGIGWQLQQAMNNLLQRPDNLGFSPALFPEPNSFSYMLAPYGIAVVALPVYLITGHNIILTYNLYLIATFALTAWATYLLVRYLLDAPWTISAVMGLMVAFAQFRFLHLVHIGILSIQFYILALYCLHRLINTPRLRWSVGLGLVIWLGLIAHGYLGIMSMITVAIILVYVVVWKRELVTKAFVGHFAIAFAIGLVLTWPFLAFRFDNPTFLAGRSYDEIVFFSATPAGWLSGNSLIYRDITPYRGEGSIFLGFVPLALAIVAWRYRKHAVGHGPGADQRIITPSDLVLLYGIVIVVGYVFTLGPELKIGEAFIAPLPYMLLMQLPGVSGMRVTARFILLALVGTAILGGYALTILSKRATKLTYWVVVSLVIGMLLIELIPHNRKLGAKSSSAFELSSDETLLRPTVLEIDVPAINWLAQKPAGTAVLHYPVEGSASFRHWFYQQLHGQPMLNGFGNASYFPEWYINVNWHEFPSPSIIQLLKERDIRFILVHHDLLSDAENAELESRWAEFQAAWGEIPCVARFGDVNVFEAQSVPILAKNRPMTIEFNQPVPGEGWAEPEIWRGQLFQNASFQWTANEIATINIPLEEFARAAGDEISIQFRVISAMTPDILDSVTLSVNDERIALRSGLDEEGATIFRGTMSQPILNIKPEGISVSIQVDRLVTPQSLGTNNDSRMLGVAIDWLRIVPNLYLQCESYPPAG